MSRYPKDYLQHILDEVDYLLTSSQNLNKEDFLRNETLKRAFTRSLEIIGEATKNLPESFKHEYAEVHWRRMAGIRGDILPRQIRDCVEGFLTSQLRMTAPCLLALIILSNSTHR